MRGFASHRNASRISAFNFYLSEGGLRPSLPPPSVLAVSHPLFQVGDMYLIKKNLLQPSRSSTAELLKFKKLIIDANNVWRSKDSEIFVFLCGANIENQNGTSSPSKRREDLINFSKTHLKQSKFFLAEEIFKALIINSDNLLDIEKDLLDFADFVIIVLESESTFCELGAFTYNSNLREKIIVINNERYKKSPSFINLGPINSIHTKKPHHILNYKMKDDGRFTGDRIADIFPNLFSLLNQKKIRFKSDAITEFNPGLFFNKDSAMFLSDLIYLLSPIDFYELDVINKFLFGKSKDTILSRNIGILKATSYISTDKNSKYYSSLANKTFFEYKKYDIINLMSAFKNLYYKYDSKRYE